MNKTEILFYFLFFSNIYTTYTWLDGVWALSSDWKQRARKKEGEKESGKIEERKKPAKSFSLTWKRNFFRDFFYEKEM